MRTRTKQQPSLMRAATTALALAQAARRATAALAIILLTATTAWAQEAIDGLTYNTTGGYYEINDEQDLIDLATYVNAGNNASGKTFKQTQDITMTGSNFTPIGVDNSDHFGGTYDGGGYTISGLYISYSLTKFAGLFNYVKEGTVRNVILVSPSVTNTHTQSMNGYKVGALIAYTWHCTAENCHVVSPTLKATGSGNKYYGALVGESGTNSDIFTNCCYYTDNASLAGIGESPRGGVSRAYTVTLGDGVTTSTAAAFTCKGTDYYKSGAIVTLPAAPAGYINAYTVNGLPIDGTSFTISADATVALSRTLDPAHFADNGDGTYTIKTATGWSVFCDCLDDNDTYNRFSGKTVCLGADITVTRMAGSDHHDFCGTFDGQGHTLTLDISSDSRPYTAPFAYVSETTPTGGNEVSHPAIRNLNVTGTVNATKEYASGLVGAFWGTLTIENCTSSVSVNTSNKYAAGFISNAQGNAIIRNCLSSATINSTVSGDGTHAGFIGVASSVNLNIEGCAFTGSLLGTTTHSCAGFVGYGGTVTITNSLYAPASVTVGATESATFARGNTPATTNSYYSAALGTAQGKAVRTVTAGEGVTLGHYGVATEYSVSGITAYKASDACGDSDPFIAGIIYNNVLYAGSGDAVILTLRNSSGDAPLGYQWAYSVTGGATLSGTTLTMADADVTVSLNNALLSTRQPVTVAYTTADGTTDEASAIALDGTETEIGQDGEETWYFVGADISYSGTINCNGNVNIILADGYTMTVNNNNGILGLVAPNDILTIYGQTLGTGTLDITATNYGIYYGFVVIRGGTVTATGTNGYGINADGNVTITGGQITATGNSNGIYAGGDVTITGGKVTATGNVNGIIANGGDVTITGGQVTGNIRGIFAGGDITLGWTNASDFIKATSYCPGFEKSVNIADGQTLYDEDGNEYSGDVVDYNDHLAGKTLRPYDCSLALRDDADNTAAIADANGKVYNVTLSGRTLYKDGGWNTLCLPFSVGDEEAESGHELDGTPLEGATLMTLGNSPACNTGFDPQTGTLNLEFLPATTVEPGVAYIVKWPIPDGMTDEEFAAAYAANPDDYDLKNPIFTAVTVTNDNPADHATTSDDTYVTFVGTYDQNTVNTEDRSILFLGAANTLYYPSGKNGPTTIGSFRAYFQLNNGLTAGTPSSPKAVRAFSLNFGDENTTGIISIENGKLKIENSAAAAWYDLQGRKLSAQPTARGIYIHGGKKVIIK